MYPMQQQTAALYPAASNSAFVCRQAATSAHLNGLSSCEHRQNVLRLTWASLSSDCIDPTRSEQRRPGDGSPLIRDRLTPFAVRDTKRERAQTSLGSSLLILYDALLLRFSYLTIGFFLQMIFRRLNAGFTSLYLDKKKTTLDGSMSFSLWSKRKKNDFSK